MPRPSTDQVRAKAEIRNFINGKYVAAKADSSFEVAAPATEKSYASSPVSGAADVDAAFWATAEYVKDHTSSSGREPIGVIGQVVPWNYPPNMAVWKIAPAIVPQATRPY